MEKFSKYFEGGELVELKKAALLARENYKSELVRYVQDHYADDVSLESRVVMMQERLKFTRADVVQLNGSHLDEVAIYEKIFEEFC